MPICIPKDIIDTVDEIFSRGLPTLERERLLQPILGDSTKEINKLYEHSLTLKNQERAYTNFVETITGINAEKKAILKDKIAKELQRKREMMYNSDGTVNENFLALTKSTPEEIEGFVKKTLDNKYDISVTPEQTKMVVDLKEKVNTTKKLPMVDPEHYDPQYGEAVDDLSNYIGALKDPTQDMKLGEQIAYNVKKFKESYGQADGAFQKGWVATKAAKDFVFSSTWKTIKASLDYSFAGIQGVAVVTRNPKLFVESIKKATNAFIDKEAMKAFRIDLFSRVGYDDAVKSGLRVLIPEEQFAATGVEKLWGIGGAFKRSDDAFSIFLQNARMGEYQRVVKNQEALLGRKLDIKIPEDAKLLEDFASHANKISGTTNLGVGEKYAEGMNQVLFAGRYAVSDLRMFTDVLNPALTKEGRSLATKTLALHLGTLYGGYLTWAMLNPDRAEINPNNANFMKIRVGKNTWVGPKLKGQWAIQAIAKLVEGSEVNASGKETVYGKGYNAKTRGDVLLHTLRGKLAPIPSVLTDLAVGKDFSQRPITPLGEVRNLAAPISAGNIFERIITGDTDISNQLILGFADATGLSGYQVGGN